MKQFFKILRLYILFLTAFEVMRLYFILYNAHLFPDSLPMTFLQTAYNGLRLDLSAAAYCMLPLILGMLFAYASDRPFAGRILKIILGTELFIIFILTLSDPELYLQWGNKFNNQVLVYITHPREMALSAGSANWLRTGLFTLFTLPVFIYLFRRGVAVLDRSNAASWQHIVVTLFTAALSFLFIRGGVGVATISQASAIYSSNQACNAAAVNSLWNAFYYIINDTRALYGDAHRIMSDEEAGQIFRRDIGSNSQEISLSASGSPNIIVVLLESFTASGSRFFGGAYDCMPFLDSIAGDNLSFTRCYSSGDRTEKGLVSVNSGYPAQPLSSVIIFPDKVKQLPGLSKVLAAKGYRNTFLYGGDAEFASMKSYLLMQSFHEVSDKGNFPASSLKSKWGAHDGELFSMAISQMGKEKQPFYSVILTLSSHEPFDVPYHSAGFPRDRWYGFKNSLRYADSCLFVFLKACESQPWYDNTLIVLVADHGHDIGLSDVHYFGKEKYHIPLVVTGGALRKELRGHKVESVVSQTIIPSLLLSGKDREAFGWQTASNASLPFAQYHYNNGFGRVYDSAECVSDNASGSLHYTGRESFRDSMVKSGKVFQQVLIEDFLKK